MSKEDDINIDELSRRLLEFFEKKDGVEIVQKFLEKGGDFSFILKNSFNLKDSGKDSIQDSEEPSEVTMQHYLQVCSGSHNWFNFTDMIKNKESNKSDVNNNVCPQVYTVSIENYGFDEVDTTGSVSQGS